jgi:hypothetical protein
LWFGALVICVGVGVGLGLHGHFPRRFGVYLAGAAFVAGLALGPRGAWLPVVGIVACGVTLVVRLPPAPPLGVDDGRQILTVFFTILPAMYALPALLGAAVHRLLRSLGAGPTSHHQTNASRDR